MAELCFEREFPLRQEWFQIDGKRLNPIGEHFVYSAATGRCLHSSHLSSHLLGRHKSHLREMRLLERLPTFCMDSQKFRWKNLCCRQKGKRMDPHFRDRWL